MLALRPVPKNIGLRPRPHVFPVARVSRSSLVCACLHLPEKSEKLTPVLQAKKGQSLRLEIPEKYRTITRVNSFKTELSENHRFDSCVS